MEAYVAPGDRRERARAAPGREAVLPPRAPRPRPDRATRTSSSSRPSATPRASTRKPRVDRELLAQVRRGDHRLARRAWPAKSRTHLDGRPDRRGARGRRVVRRAVPGPLLPRGAGARRRRRAGEAQRSGLRARRRARPAGDRHERRALPARRDHDAHDVLLCIGLGKDRSDLDRMRYDDGLYFKSAPEIARLVPGPPRRAREHARASPTRSTSPSRRSTTCRPSRSRRASATENELLVTLADGRRAERYGDRLPANVRERLDYELGVITKTGYAGYFLIVCGLHQGGARPRHPGGPGPRLGGRLARRLRAAHHRRLSAQVRSPLRALPESRARVDARHRRGLLLRAPRRGDRVRAPEVRQRVGRPDRHVRHDEVARRDQGRRPHARLHAGRDRRAREADPEPAELLR